MAAKRCSHVCLNTLMTRSSSTFPSTATKLHGLSRQKPTSASRFLNRLSHSRIPVELGAAQSMMPLHSITASALFTSLLSLSNKNWGCLSEGFATPL